MLTRPTWHDSRGLHAASARSTPARRSAWSFGVLLHLPRRELPQALGEIRRVLRAGGPLALSMKEGDGEAWEKKPLRGMPDRFFARYRLSEL